MSADQQPFGVYVHIPFCASKCDYCAFATWTDRHHLTTAYLEALRVEIERAVADGMPVATTVFVGGGTPSMVPPHELGAVIDTIPKIDGAEVSVECNPDDVDAALLRAFVEHGVNRVSLGVQSMATHVLGTLGRRHDQRNVDRAVVAIREVGLPTFNLDIIYGAAGESVEDWRRTVDAVVALEPPHVSAYGLTVEPGTPLAADTARHPDDDDQADKYEVVDDGLTAAGLENYEISNWAKPGHECEHNMIYWRQENYRGFGCAAHSHDSGRRWWNVRTPDRYIDLVADGKSTEAAGETLDADTREFERLELLLRLRPGVPLDALDGDELPGLVERAGDRWVLTRAGRLMQNDIATRLKT
ncbi:MAG: radical SAM family heme chaperone HemW [Ilumatobacter fluminis]|uniref:radical SAM family heme chaperone HemW n=1 Tax=Ilumatobacter fluminis TaxID=467091 RepID=UPI0032EF6BFF